MQCYKVSDNKIPSPQTQKKTNTLACPTSLIWLHTLLGISHHFFLFPPLSLSHLSLLIESPCRVGGLTPSIARIIDHESVGPTATRSSMSKYSVA